MKGISYLDLAPQRVHDGDEWPCYFQMEARDRPCDRCTCEPKRHPDSCGCCFRTPRQEIPFDPWFNEPKQIAGLYRWLKMRDRLPEDPADFIEHAETWGQDYADMCMWAGPA